LPQAAQRVNLIINGHRGITAETAMLLAQVFDTSPQFWTNAQAAFDLWAAQQDLRARKRA
jgi:addiction module HigA family antidote